MRSSYPRIALVALGIALLIVGAIPSFGEDYLVIKKKDGTTQRVPLEIAPDQIESFRVEPSTEPAMRPGQEPSAAARSKKPRAGEEEPPAKPLEITPGAPPSSPMVQEKRPSRPSPSQRPMIEREEVRPVGPRGAEAPRKLEVAPPPERKPVTGAEMGPATVGFTVNLYKLPQNVKALPDYSAFRPEKVLTSDKINLGPTKGEQEPAGLPEKAEGLGLRFMGTFLVSGEGIFQWRVHAKDGVRVHIDDKTLIENDGIHEASSKVGFTHLAEGVHTILVDSFNSTGRPVLQLFVNPPLGQEELFSIGSGLRGWQEPTKPYDVLWGQVYFVPKGEYPKGPDFSKISPIGRIIAPDLSIAGAQGIPGVPGRTEMIGIRYEGFFTMKGAGIFAFRLRTDNFAKLTIGQHTIAEITGGLKSNPEGKLGWAFLQEGSYPIALEYFHPRGEATLQLYVSEPDKQEKLFSPSAPLEGFASDTGKMNLIPAFVYFLKPDTRKLPNFNALTPAGMFFTRAIDYPVDRGSREFPGVPRREEWLGIRFYVKFSLTEEEEGEYKFRVIANDGARLIVGKKLVVDADGYGKTNEKSGTVTMKAGSHEMFLDYYQGVGPSGVQLFITPPGGQEKIFAFQ